MAKNAPHIVLLIGSCWIFINVPRDVTCQISHCWVYPVAPFPRNGQNMTLMAKTWSIHGLALYGQNMVHAWSLKMVLTES